MQRAISVNAGIIRPAFEAKCDHDDLDVDLRNGLPIDRQNDVRNQWETVLPVLITDRRVTVREITPTRRRRTFTQTKGTGPKVRDFGREHGHHRQQRPALN